MSLYWHFPKSSRNEPDARSMRERCDIECARRGRVTSIATRSPAASPPLLLREPTPRSLSALSPQTRSSGRAGIRGLWLSLRRIGSDRRLSRDFASQHNRGALRTWLYHISRGRTPIDRSAEWDRTGMGTKGDGSGSPVPIRPQHFPHFPTNSDLPPARPTLVFLNNCVCVPSAASTCSCGHVPSGRSERSRAQAPSLE